MTPNPAAATTCRAFLAALASKDVKWGSAQPVAGLFSEEARMMTLDKQRHDGRAAIIRRLNAGQWLGREACC
jgi:hypothetical protein